MPSSTQQPVLKHLLLTTAEDAFDLKAWSGIPYSLRMALERQVERVSVFRPSRPARTPLDAAKRLLYGGTPPRYPLALTSATFRQNARELRAEIKRLEPDAVLAISCHMVVGLGEVGRPVFMFSDAPWQAWHEAYAGTLSRPVMFKRVAQDEAAAARTLDGLGFSSQWAIDQAARLYSLGNDRSLRERMHITPLGANWTPTTTREEVLSRMRERDLSPDAEIRLLYLGKDWERKGGPLAVEVAERLHAACHPVRLDIVGCRPDLPAGTETFIHTHGLLYQNDPVQSAQLAEMFSTAHFLIVPTTAECFGIVFAEAQAFALPPISRAIQALPTVIEDGVTGMLLDPHAPASTYVDRILALRADPAAYRTMAECARDRFETFLNWDYTAGVFKQEFEASIALRASDRRAR